MREVTDVEIYDRLAFDNPWWEENGGVDGVYIDYPRRTYFDPFQNLVTQSEVNRAIILFGPRRVGKTVMVYHTIHELLEQGVPGENILYLSLDTPIYTGISLNTFIQLFQSRFSHSRKAQLYIFFDEIQYLREWEVHLKSLVDSFKAYRFIATGSAAAALRLKSTESGAGRFTEFMLPSLTFAEYLRFIEREVELLHPAADRTSRYWTDDIQALNKEFINYLNFGGFPEAVFSPAIQADSARYIKSDIIDKVLLRDLPSLYGISDIQELNRLFTTLAYNTGEEVGLEGLSQSSGVAKNTLKRYIEYLEAAFLIRRVRRIDGHAKHFKRLVTFKVYLTNPSMWAALFGPVHDKHGAMGALTETAIWAQWFHQQNFITNLHYARWPRGEVDIVGLFSSGGEKNILAVEIKWSDRPATHSGEIKGLVSFAQANQLMHGPLVTTKTVSGDRTVEGVTVRFQPSSIYCYTVGKNLLGRMDWL